jgi:hypothetical protein
MKTRNVLGEAPADHLLRLLVGDMRISFKRLQRRVAAQPVQEGLQPETTSETELESLVRQARREQVRAASAERRKRL